MKIALLNCQRLAAIGAIGLLRGAESVVVLGTHLADLSLGVGDGVDGGASNVTAGPVVAHDALRK